jgi:hypothetical protein
VGAGTWNTALLIPIVKSSIHIIVKEGATPRRLIATAVIAGVTIIKYLAAVLSAIIPIKGFKNQGMRIIRSQIDAMARDTPNFSISNGLSGARKEE